MQKNVRVREAAELLGLSKSTLDKLRHYGTGPRFFRLGRAVIYDTNDLIAWRDERAVAPANDNTASEVAA
ncbi:helix-turn-helix transcriptional regulator [Rhizobium rosettiformans]|uniref:Helix-turn-helix domain-containing protein n=1 Tax=Rhizobium rosettiformans W3 TaxID=538378 RepID=A0A4S8Q2I6_9HYPH|nr:helix-turn-helix domain-containing protein [Rhizobium rosettiformans]THV38363.1 helix-turn-helix domain-containing protein [Rhizobium rosettiformans W3]